MEIWLPRPANGARSPANCAAVTDNPLPWVMSAPVPVGCRTFEGSPCSCTGSSAAAATRTTPRSTAYPIARVIGVAAGRLPSVPKLMLMASAPRSTAWVIDVAMLESDRSDLMMSRRQSSPAPASPAPLSESAQAKDATWVPCPISSVVAGPAPAVASLSIAPTIFGASSGWSASIPVSITATVALAPRVISHSAGRFCRAAHHCRTVPGGTPMAGSSVVKAGSSGALRSTWRRSTSTEATCGSARRASAAACDGTPAPGRTVTRRSCGDTGPATRAPVDATAARAATVDAWAPAAVGLSVTSSRPVTGSAAPAGVATAAATTAAPRTTQTTLRA